MLRELITAGRYISNDIDKKKQEQDMSNSSMAQDNISEGLEKSSPSVNFMDGFKYQDMSLENEHSSAGVDMAEVKNAEVQQMLGTPILNIKYTPEEKVAYYDSLSSSEQRIFDSYVEQGYGFNAAKTLMENKKDLKNPSAEGLDKYEKKDASMIDKAKDLPVIGFPFRILNALPGLARGLGSGVVNAYNREKEDIMENLPRVLSSDEPFLGKYFHVGGELADIGLGRISEIVGGMIEQGAKSVTTKEERDVMEGLLREYALNPIFNTETAQKWVDKYDNLSDENKQIVSDIGRYIDALSNFAEASAGVKGLEAAMKKGEKVVLKDMGKNIGKYKERSSNFADFILKGENLKEGANVNALKGIDTSNIKTYKELTKAMEEKNSKIIKDVDEIYKKYDNGENRIEVALDEDDKSTPFLNIIRDMESLYKETNKFDEFEKIRNLEIKLRTEGLTKTEQKSIIREYTTDFRKNVWDDAGNRKINNSSIGNKYESNRELAQKTVKEGLTEEDAKLVQALEKDYSDTANALVNSKKLETSVRKFKAMVDKSSFSKRLIARAYHLFDNTGIARIWQTLSEATKLGSSSQLNPMRRENYLAGWLEDLARNEKLIGEIEKGMDIVESASKEGVTKTEKKVAEKAFDEWLKNNDL